MACETSTSWLINDISLIYIYLNHCYYKNWQYSIFLRNYYWLNWRNWQLLFVSVSTTFFMIIYFSTFCFTQYLAPFLFKFLCFIFSTTNEGKNSSKIDIKIFPYKNNAFNFSLFSVFFQFLYPRKIPQESLLILHFSTLPFGIKIY